MGLMAALLGFVLKKAGALLAIVVSLFLGYLLIQALVPSLREAVADRGRLERVAAERAELEQNVVELRSDAAQSLGDERDAITATVEDEIRRGREKIDLKEAEIDRLRNDEAKVCGTGDKIIAWLLPGDACKTAQEAVQKADEALDTLEGGLRLAQADAEVLDSGLSDQQALEQVNQGGTLSPAQRKLDNTEADLSQKRAEEKSLQQAQNSGSGWVVNQWLRSWRWLAGLAILVLLLPVVARFLSYFVLMPIVSRIHKPIHLADGVQLPAAAESRTTVAQRSMAIELENGEVLSARSEHLRLVQGKPKTALLYDWRAPFVSFAAGLWELSRLTGDANGTSATLSTPNDPDSYLMRIDFTDHPGLMLRPKHVVGVVGAPRLHTRWRWGIQALARWQVRYILFTGTGSLIVQGKGDVVADSPSGRFSKMDQNLVMGFDSRLSVGVRRTESFWPYLRGRKPLIDDEFTGTEGAFFWQKATTDGPSNPIARVFNAIFSAFGKLLGF